MTATAATPIAIDPGARTARVGPGVTWAELDAATQVHGLAAGGPRISHLEVVSSVADGPSGWLDRPLGKPAVLDGEGVVLRLHPVGPSLLCGFLGFPRRRAGEIARAYRDLLAQAPASVGGGLALFAGRGGACTVVWCSLDESVETLERLRALRPSLDAVTENDYRAFQAMSDMHNPRGAREHRRYGRIETLTDAVIDAAIEAADRPAPALSHLLLLPRADTSWAYECAGIWPPLASLDRGTRDWVETVAAALGS